MAPAQRPVLAVGEFPYGPPPPDAVTLASGVVRAVLHYRLALGAEQALLPAGGTYFHVAETLEIAQSRLARAVIGSMRNTEPPIGGHRLPPPDDPEATNAANGDAEAQLIHEAHQRELAAYAQPPPYAVYHEAVLEAALLYRAETATQGWEVREAQAIANSRGYFQVTALLCAAFPEVADTIEEYARAS